MKQNTSYQVQSTEIDPERIVPMSNYVLVTIDRDLSQFVLQDPKSGLYIDTSWEPEKYAITTATVVAVPKGLVYHEWPHHKDRPGGEPMLEYDTDMELMKGDQVYFSYLSMNKAITDGRMMRDADDNYFALIRYDRIYCGIRQGRIIPVNGWIIAEQKARTAALKSKILTLIDYTPQYSDTEMTVIAAGSINREYYHDRSYTDMGFVQTGDDVIVHPTFVAKLEKQMFRLNDFDYVRFQEKDVIAKVVAGEIVPNQTYCYINKLESPMSKTLQDTEKWNSFRIGEVIDFHKDVLKKGDKVGYCRAYERTLNIGGKHHTFVTNVNGVAPFSDDLKVLAP